MLKHILSALCTKENVAMAVLAVAGIAVAVSSTVEAAPKAEPDFDFERDIYRNPEFFKDVMEDIGIWTPEEKV